MAVNNRMTRDFHLFEESFSEDWKNGMCPPGVSIYTDAIVTRVGNCYTLQTHDDFIVFPAAVGPIEPTT